MVTQTMPDRDEEAAVLRQKVETALEIARQAGADGAEVTATTQSGLGVNVRLGEIETLEPSGAQTMRIIQLGKVPASDIQQLIDQLKGDAAGSSGSSRRSGRSNSGNRGSSSHRRADQVSPAARALPTFKIPVGCRSAAFFGGQAVVVHAETHGAAWLPPFEPGLSEDFVEALFFSLLPDQA